MTIARFPFDGQELAINIDDDALLEKFMQVFQCEREPAKPFDKCITLSKNNQQECSVQFDSSAINNLSESEAVYEVAQIIGNEICKYAQGDIAILHSATVLTKYGALALFGPSGSGKTTLSILLSKYCKYLGDEFGLINLDRGTIWHERHPIQLKCGNPVLLPNVPEKSSLKTTGGPVGESYYIPLDLLPYEHTSKENDIPIAALMLPTFDKGFPPCEIEELSANAAPQAILESLLGAREPSSLFATFVKMIAAKDIKLYRLRYSDSDHAVKSIIRRMEEDLTQKRNHLS